MMIPTGKRGIMPDNSAGEGRRRDVNNEVSGLVQGPVVQAGTINGDVRIDQSRIVQQRTHIHQHNNSPQNFPSLGPGIAWIRWLGLQGVIALIAGEYTGMVVGGLVALITGQAFSRGSEWPATIILIAPIGAILGFLLALATQKRLATDLRYRKLKFACIGLITFPIAIASSDQNQNAMGTFLFAGVVAGLIFHIVRRSRINP